MTTPQEATQERLTKAMQPVASKLKALWVHPGIKSEQRIAEKLRRNRRRGYSTELTDVVRGSLILPESISLDEAEALIFKRIDSTQSKLAKHFCRLEQDHPSLRAKTTFVRKVLLRDKASGIIVEIQLHTCVSFWRVHVATHGAYEVRRRLPAKHACVPYLFDAATAQLVPRDATICFAALKALIDDSGRLSLIRQSVDA